MVKAVSISINTLKEARRFYDSYLEQIEGRSMPAPDLIEWRVDGGFLDMEVLEDVAIQLSMLGLPIIFTLRTIGEGGEARITQEAYYAILDFAIKRLPISLIDIEADSLPAKMRHPLVIAAAEKNIKVIMSKHLLKSVNPDEALETLTALLRKGGDIAKLAFLPESIPQATAVMEDCSLLSDKGLDVVVIPMGEAYRELRYDEGFGFFMQFYAWDEETAPGQKRWGYLM